MMDLVVMDAPAPEITDLVDDVPDPEVVRRGHRRVPTSRQAQRARHIETVMLHYTALPTQRVFHDSTARYRLYLGAYRSGKTVAGSQEAIRHAIYYPGSVGLVGRLDFTDLRDTTMVTFFEQMPGKLLRKYNKTEHRVEFPNGSLILFRELKDEAGIGSLNLAWFWVDEAEEISETMFKRLQGRLSDTRSKHHAGWLTSNPPNVTHWLYELFQKAPQPGYEMFRARTYDNIANLPEGYIKDLESQPEAWRKKYLEGEWGYTPSGKPVYTEYRSALHKARVQWIPSRPVHVGWDFGYHSPAILCCQIDDRDRLLCLREFQGRDMTVDVFANAVKQRLNRWFPGGSFSHYGDPAGHQKSDKDNYTTIEILKSHGFHIAAKGSEILTGLEIVSRKMARLIEGVPTFLVSEHCRILDEGLSGGYHYPEIRTGKKQSPDLLPDKDGVYDHINDCLRYICVHLFAAVEQNRQQEKVRRERAWQEREMLESIKGGTLKYA